MDDFKEGQTEGLLATENAIAEGHLKRPARSRRRAWYNYCIFGGIGGLSVM